jgi:hypothetical protein
MEVSAQALVEKSALFAERLERLILGSRTSTKSVRR